MKSVVLALWAVSAVGALVFSYYSSRTANVFKKWPLRVAWEFLISMLVWYLALIFVF